MTKQLTKYPAFGKTDKVLGDKGYLADLYDVGAPVKFKKCPECGCPMPVRDRKHKKRDCPSYSDLWAGDIRMKLFGALKAYGEITGDGAAVRMITVTAPGEDYGLVWDKRHCGHRFGCSGTKGCRVLPAAAKAWNLQAPASWRQLNKAARRICEAEGLPVSLLVRAWEYQKRGVLHLHLIVGYSERLEKAGVDWYIHELREFAPKYGFGFVDGHIDVKEPVAAAAYLSSYFVTGKGNKMALRETVTQPDLPRSVFYVKPELSRKSGLTMRSLRLKRYLYHAIGQEGLDVCRVFGIAYEDAYIIYTAGFWGRALTDVLVADRIAKQETSTEG